jgi:hypothetical protein
MRHVGPKVLIGFSVQFLDNVLKSTGKDSSKEGLDVFPIINTKLTQESDVG